MSTLTLHGRTHVVSCPECDNEMLGFGVITHNADGSHGWTPIDLAEYVMTDDTEEHADDPNEDEPKDTPDGDPEPSDDPVEDDE